MALASNSRIHCGDTHHDHAVQASALDKESLEFELQTRRLQRERQQLVVADLERRVGDLANRDGGGATVRVWLPAIQGLS